MGGSSFTILSETPCADPHAGCCGEGRLNTAPYPISGDLACLGEGIGYVNKFYFDKTGKQINEFDVLKVFHFIGARRKRHYMYKWVRRDDKGRMAIMHLTASDEPTVPLSVCANKEGVFEDAEIMQSRSR